MNTVGYKVIPNATSTKDVAPYLGLAIPAGSLAFDNILQKMVDAGTHMTTATARYLLEASYELFAEIVAEENMRVATGTVTVHPSISGGFPSEDADFDPARNSLFVGASINQALQAEVGGMKPAFAGEASGASSVRMHTAYDLGTMERNTIHGLGEFRIAGIDLAVPDGEDESLELWTQDLSAKAADITCLANDGGQQLTVKLAAPGGLDKGRYRLRLVSHGLDPTAPLATVTLPVTVAEDIPATLTVTRIKAENQESDNVVGFLDTTHDVVVHGTALDGITANDMYVVMEDAEGTQLDKQRIDTSGFTASASALTFTNGLNPINRNVPDGDYLDNKAFILIEKNGNVVKFEFDYV